jgi:hypothetical protein
MLSNNVNFLKCANVSRLTKKNLRNPLMHARAKQEAGAKTNLSTTVSKPRQLNAANDASTGPSPRRGVAAAGKPETSSPPASTSSPRQLTSNTLAKPTTSISRLSQPAPVSPAIQSPSRRSLAALPATSAVSRTPSAANAHTTAHRSLPRTTSPTTATIANATKPTSTVTRPQSVRLNPSSATSAPLTRTLTATSTSSRTSVGNTSAHENAALQAVKRPSSLRYSSPQVPSSPATSHPAITSTKSPRATRTPTTYTPHTVTAKPAASSAASNLKARSHSPLAGPGLTKKTVTKSQQTESAPSEAIIAAHDVAVSTRVGAVEQSPANQSLHNANPATLPAHFSLSHHDTDLEAGDKTRFRDDDDKGHNVKRHESGHETELEDALDFLEKQTVAAVVTKPYSISEERHEQTDIEDIREDPFSVLSISPIKRFFPAENMPHIPESQLTSDGPNHPAPRSASNLSKTSSQSLDSPVSLDHSNGKRDSSNKRDSGTKRSSGQQAKRSDSALSGGRLSTEQSTGLGRSSSGGFQLNKTPSKDVNPNSRTTPPAVIKRTGTPPLPSHTAATPHSPSTAHRQLPNKTVRVASFKNEKTTSPSLVSRTPSREIGSSMTPSEPSMSPMLSTLSASPPLSDHMKPELSSIETSVPATMFARPSALVPGSLRMPEPRRDSDLTTDFQSPLPDESDSSDDDAEEPDAQDIESVRQRPENRCVLLLSLFFFALQKYQQQKKIMKEKLPLVPHEHETIVFIVCCCCLLNIAECVQTAVLWTPHGHR